jgi:hypothetical protein
MKAYTAMMVVTSITVWLLVRWQIGYQTGYHDGIIQARKDMYKNKPFNTLAESMTTAMMVTAENGAIKTATKAQYTVGYRAGQI